MVSKPQGGWINIRFSGGVEYDLDSVGDRETDQRKHLALNVRWGLNGGWIPSRATSGQKTVQACSTGYFRGERFLAPHRRQSRGHHRRINLGPDQLPGFKCDRIAANGLARSALRAQAPSHLLHSDIYLRVGALRHGDKPWISDYGPHFARRGRWRMLPVSQAILLESFPPEKRGAGMAAFAMGVVVAPILGPTLGGWITDNYSWRWIFYINLPVGIIAALMTQNYIEDPPYIQAGTAGKIDLPGFLFLSLWLGALQVVLDKGEEEAWFESEAIRWLCALSVISFLCFLIRELLAEAPIVDLRVLKNRNFSVGLTLITLVGVVLYGTTAALPIFLQTSLGYPALQSGLAMSPRGIGAFVATTLVGRLVGKIKNRILILIGFCLLTFSSFWLGQISLEISPRNVIWPSILNGIAVSFIFVPLTTSAMGHLAQSQIANASGLYNLMRNPVAALELQPSQL